jgi:hypothetical protein
MRNALIYTGKKVTFNHNEQMAYTNLIKNEDGFEIRKNMDDQKMNSLPIRLEIYLQTSKIADVIELINLLFFIFLYFNSIYDFNEPVP